MEARAGRREAEKVKAARSGNLSGFESCSELSQSQPEDSTTEPTARDFPSRHRVIESEASILERGADVLARSPFASAGPAMEHLGRALELLLRAEAKRKRQKARHGRSLAALFPAEVPA